MLCGILYFNSIFFYFTEQSDIRNKWFKNANISDASLEIKSSVCVLKLLQFVGANIFDTQVEPSINVIRAQIFFGNTGVLNTYFI